MSCRILGVIVNINGASATVCEYVVSKVGNAFGNYYIVNVGVTKRLVLYSLNSAKVKVFYRGAIECALADNLKRCGKSNGGSL